MGARIHLHHRVSHGRTGPLGLVGLLAVALLLVCCSRCKPRGKSPVQSTAVRFRPVGAAETTLRLGLRATYRERSAPIGKLTTGLLYVYPRARALGVDLSTSESSVDVILLGADKRVLRVAPGLPPRATRRVDVVPSLHSYAILLPSGTAKRRGIVVKTPVSFSVPARAAPSAVLLPVDLHAPGRRTVRVHAELALQEKERNMGLMYRTHLPPRGGMLFRFPEAHHIEFWMKNTLISLDMIFISDNRVVTGVVSNTKPRDETPVGVGRVLSRYVLEVRAGFANRHGITRGTRVTFAVP